MSTTQADGAGRSGADAVPIEVFWRPGCPFCTGLRGVLLDHEVTATWRNIWEDRQAREIVRSANRGNEIVPTVRIGNTTLTNPSWRDLAPHLGRDVRERPKPTARRRYASAGACGPEPDERRPTHAAARWTVFGLLVAGTYLAAEISRPGLAVVLGILTTLAWVWTRPGPR